MPKVERCPWLHTMDFICLSMDANSRQQAYWELYRYHLEPGMIDRVSCAKNVGFALGSEAFQAQIADVLKRRVTPGKAGGQ